MAKPIKETPVLRGKDAAAFMKNMKDKQRHRTTSPLSDRIKKNFDKLNRIAKF